MAMFNNTSDLLTSFKIDLGIYSIALPIENVDDFLIKILQLKTLPTFSIFLPYKFPINVNMAQLPCIESGFERSRYILPTALFPEQRIIYVLGVHQKSNLPGAGYATSIYSADFATYQGAMLSQINADLISSISPPFTFEFVAPNILVMYNLSAVEENLEIELGIEHAKNFVTIPPSQWETFKELAILDIKAALYDAVKHYEDLPTAYANIQLKIDDWQSAASDRRDLVNTWKDSHHLDMPAYLII